ncbi:MAG TPA: PqqD family protein [Candidatus Methylomirabilis sp.]|nr:PqqD family protein [Candidatus Methylomirabilis sp.]
MTPETVFRINTLPFAHQVIEGEVVIVNVDDGTYYSLRDTGADVWMLLEGGASVREVADELGRRYQADPAEIRAGVEHLLTELVRERIVSPEPDGTPSRHAVPTSSDPAKAAFTRPALERFTDMKDLLLLDPIHEGGDTGWPIVKYPQP